MSCKSRARAKLRSSGISILALAAGVTNETGEHH